MVGIWSDFSNPGLWSMNFRIKKLFNPESRNQFINQGSQCFHARILLND